MRRSSLFWARRRPGCARRPGVVMITEAPAAVAPKRDHDPSWLIQRAWSVFRLPRLQELIIATIAELRVGPLPGLGQGEGARPAGPDPTSEALRVCCDELRAASGIPGADAERAQHVAMIHRYMREESLDWSQTFARSLETYRQAAAQAVERAFARAHVS